MRIMMPGPFAFDYIHPEVQDLLDSLGIKLHTFIEINAMGIFPAIHHYNYACGVYEVRKDVIGLNEFIKPKFVNSVILHEIIHWTGHPRRLNRPYIVCGLKGYPGNIFMRDTEEAIAQYGMNALAHDLGISRAIRSEWHLEDYLKFYPNADLSEASQRGSDAAEWILDLVHKKQAA